MLRLLLLNRSGQSLRLFRLSLNYRWDLCLLRRRLNRLFPLVPECRLNRLNLMNRWDREHLRRRLSLLNRWGL